MECDHEALYKVTSIDASAYFKYTVPAAESVSVRAGFDYLRSRDFGEDSAGFTRHAQENFGTYGVPPERFAFSADAAQMLDASQFQQFEQVRPNGPGAVPGETHRTES
jgi:hypothetical protein